MEMLEEAPLCFRAPSWAERGTIRLRIDGVDRPVEWSGAEIAIGNLRPGQTAVVTYDLPEREIADTIAGSDYISHWRGGTVTSITPAGERYPIYQRSAFETADIPMIDRAPLSQPVVVRW
jgi:hypothetical protein